MPSYPRQTALVAIEPRQQLLPAMRCSSLSDEDTSLPATRCPSMTLSATSSESATENETPPPSPPMEQLSVDKRPLLTSLDKRFFIYEPELSLDAETPRASPYQRKDYMSPIPEAIDDDAEDEAEPADKKTHWKHGAHRTRGTKRDHPLRRRSESHLVQPGGLAFPHNGHEASGLLPPRHYPTTSQERTASTTHLSCSPGTLHRPARPTLIAIPAANHAIGSVARAFVGLGLKDEVLSILQTPKASSQLSLFSQDPQDLLLQEIFPPMPFPESDHDFDPPPPSAFRNYNLPCRLRPSNPDEPISPLDPLPPSLLSEGATSFIPGLQIQLANAPVSGSATEASMPAGAFLAIASSANGANIPANLTEGSLQATRIPSSTLRRCPRTSDLERFAEESFLHQRPSQSFHGDINDS